MQKRAYLDNAATTPLRPEVLEAMLPYLTQHYGNPSSIHHEGRVTRAAIESARKTVASLIGASTAEIFFTSGGTESNNTAVKCSVRDLGVKRIISSPVEHHCVKHAVQRIGNQGVRIDLLQVDQYGLPNLGQLEELLQHNAEPTLVSLMHANNELGSITDISAVSALCRQYGAWLHSDTVQTIAHLPINVQEMSVDFLSGAAHKFGGPKGIGFLYINSRCRIHPFIDGGAQERNMRAGTENIAGIVGLAKAMELAYADLEDDMAHIYNLREYMKAELLKACPDLKFNGHPEEVLPTVLSVSFPPGQFSELLILSLDIAGVSASSGSACSSGAETQSHVLQAIHHPAERKAVRFSFSKDNTREEIDFAVEKIKEILAEGMVKAGGELVKH